MGEQRQWDLMEAGVCKYGFRSWTVIGRNGTELKRTYITKGRCRMNSNVEIVIYSGGIIT